MDWLTAGAQLRSDGLPGVLVTVIKVRGHAPHGVRSPVSMSQDIAALCGA